MKKAAQLALAALLLFTACNADSRHGIPENCEDLDRTDVYEVANFAYLAMMDEDIEELMCLVDKENEKIDLEWTRELFEVKIESFYERKNTEKYEDLEITFLDPPLEKAKGPLFRQYSGQMWTEREKSYQLMFAESPKHSEFYTVVLIEDEDKELYLLSPFESPDIEIYNNFKDYTFE